MYHARAPVRMDSAGRHAPKKKFSNFQILVLTNGFFGDRIRVYLKKAQAQRQKKFFKIF